MARSSANTVITLNFDGLPSKRWKSPLDAALFYARQGMKIFPCHYVKEDDEGKPLPEEDWKKPPLDGWPSGATTDVEQIKRWWTRWPDALIGHRPGDSGCVVFDVDVKHGAPGKANWDALKLDDDDCARVARTRSGGWHYTYERGDVGPVSNKDLRPGINVRCDNGYVILPSPGNGYHWAKWGAVGPMPQGLADLLRSVQKNDRATGEASSDGWKVTGALSRWRDRIQTRWRRSAKKKAWIGYLTTTVQDIIPKNKLDEGNRSDIVWAMEKDFCELGIPQGDAFELIWPMALCKWQGRRDGERSLREEIDKAYAEHDAEHEKKSKSDSFGTLSDVVEEDVRYLWKPYIPYGMVVIFEGDPKAGKSYVAMWLAATLSVGIAPDGSKIKPLKILYVTKENPEKFIFKARNRVMGGNAENIRYLQDKKLVFDEEGLKAFEEEVMTNRPDVIVVDVLNSFVPPHVNISAPNEIRSVMDAVAVIAEKAGSALIFVRHWRKAGGSAMHKGAGLVDIGATAGSVVMFPRDKDDPKLHYMGHTTARASEEGPTLKFRLQGDPVAELIWEGTSDLTPDDLAGMDRDKTALDEAKEFLKEYLKNGPKLADDVETAAAALCHAERTLRRAKDDLHIIVSKETGVAHGRWRWKLPE